MMHIIVVVRFLSTLNKLVDVVADFIVFVNIECVQLKKRGEVLVEKGRSSLSR